MPDSTNTTYNDNTTPSDEKENITLHTCACGEQHRYRPGILHNRETCTSPKKFGDTRCCGSGRGPVGDHHRCGQEQFGR
jgi:hypothetical protein